MYYDIVTLDCAPLELGAVSQAAQAWSSRDGAQLLGAWRTELGELFQIRLLRGFATSQEQEDAYRRAVEGPRPFGIDPPTTWRIERYAPFPFLPDVTPATHGGVYEFRTYHLKPGGLAPTLEGWEAAIAPAHEYTRHLVINLYALDGPLRITHIWGFASLEQRMTLRAHHYQAGLWPPKGGPQQIARATSTIAIPEAYSPLR